MDSAVLQFLEKEIFLFGKLRLRVVELLLFLFLTAISIPVRISLIPVISGDFQRFLDGWMEQIRLLGGFSSLSYSIGDYTPPYLYLMSAVSYLPVDNLTAIKLITMVFDYAAALALFWCIHIETGSFSRGLMGYGALLFLPSVLFNGAMWGQCDIIYTMFLVLSLFCGLKNRSWLCCVWFGVSFAFKLQAVFFLPVLLFFWLLGKLRFKHFLMIPAVFLAALLPALLMGRNPLELLSVYGNQAATYTDALTFGLPNIYAILGDRFVAEMAGPAVLLTMALLAMMAYQVLRLKFRPEPELMLSLTVFTILLVAFTLPFMHERYTFAADIFALLLFCLRRKYFWLLVATQILTVLSYQYFLFLNEVIPLPFASLFYLGILCVLGADIYRKIQSAGKTTLPPSAT